MGHRHDNCTAPQWGAVCNSGVVSTYCDYEDCSNESCVDLGHCECLCHSGKTCGCGHEWPRMAKSTSSARVDTSQSVPIIAETDTTPGPVPQEPTREWAETLGHHVDAVWEKLWPHL